MKAKGLKVNFKTSAVNAKGERVFNMVVKGDLADAQILALDKLKGSGACFMDLYSAQAELEDYADHDDVTSEEPHKGIEYSVDKDGTAQISIDEVLVDTEATIENELPFDPTIEKELPFEPKKDELDDELF